MTAIHVTTQAELDAALTAGTACPECARLGEPPTTSTTLTVELVPGDQITAGDVVIIAWDPVTRSHVVTTLVVVRALPKGTVLIDSKWDIAETIAPTMRSGELVTLVTLGAFGGTEEAADIWLVLPATVLREGGGRA